MQGLDPQPITKKAAGINLRLSENSLETNQAIPEIGFGIGFSFFLSARRILVRAEFCS